jgi:putative ABC transport system substrate-binding protein
MSRREFIKLSGAAAMWPLAAGSQEEGRLRRIAALMSGAPDDPVVLARIAGVRQGLKNLGWSEAQNMNLQLRFAQGSSERARALVKELIALKPDVILSDTTPITAMFQQYSQTTPIVFVDCLTRLVKILSLTWRGQAEI